MPRTSTEPAIDPSGRARREAEPYSIDDQVGHLLRRAYQRATANLAQRINGHELTPMQFAALARLWEVGSASQNELGRQVAMEPANIHGLAGRLMKRGLVEAAPDPKDRRRRVLRLSAQGRALIEELIPLELAASAETTAPLSPAERETLLALLRRIGT